MTATLNPALRPFWTTRARNKILFGGRASSKCLALGITVEPKGLDDFYGKGDE